jgi:hypothetical protein
MIYLLFTAERIRSAAIWQFWRSNHVYVLAWIKAESAAEARAAATERMACKGWRITGFDRATKVAEENLPQDMYSRAQLRCARHAGFHYVFHRDSPEGGAMMMLPDVVGEEDPTLRRERSRKADADACSDAAADVPPAIRQALRLAETWAIDDDDRRRAAIASARPETRYRVLSTVVPIMDEIEAWCDARRDATPVPDEVTRLDRLLEAVTEMQANAAEANPVRSASPSS